MNCKEIQEKLSAYVDGALSPQERGAVDAHLILCQECSAYLGELKKTLKHLKELREIEPPPWLAQKIMAKVQEEAAQRQGILRRLFSPPQIKIPLEALATIAVVVTISVMVKDIAPDLEQHKEIVREAPPKAQVHEREVPSLPEKKEKATRAKKVAPRARMEAPAPALAPQQDKAEPAPHIAAPSGIPDVKGKAFETELFKEKASAPPASAPLETAKQGAQEQPGPEIAKKKALALHVPEDIVFVVRTKDVVHATRRIKEIVGESGGKVVRTDLLQGKTVLSLMMNTERINELPYKLQAVGQVKGEGKSEKRGELLLRIEIIPE